LGSVLPKVHGPSIPRERVSLHSPVVPQHFPSRFATAQVGPETVTPSPQQDAR
jgi:hypothetical protein